MSASEWERCAEIVSDFATLIATESHLLDSQSKATRDTQAPIKQSITKLQEEKCVAMASALREARRVFGAERFDRMLYQVVPPGMSIVAAPEYRGERSLRREERCQ